MNLLKVDLFQVILWLGLYNMSMTHDDMQLILG